LETISLTSFHPVHLNTRGAEMSWMKTAVMDAGPSIRLIDWSIRARKLQGYKDDHAFDDAATRLALTPRRVRALRRREIWRVPVEQYRRLLDRWWADMDRQAAELHALADKLEKQAEAEWLAHNQLQLPLEESCSAPSSRGSISGRHGSF
jgi:hypothetical protein